MDVDLYSFKIMNLDILQNYDEIILQKRIFRVPKKYVFPPIELPLDNFERDVRKVSPVEGESMKCF